MTEQLQFWIDVISVVVGVAASVMAFGFAAMLFAVTKFYLFDKGTALEVKLAEAERELELTDSNAEVIYLREMMGVAADYLNQYLNEDHPHHTVDITVLAGALAHLNRGLYGDDVALQGEQT